MALLPVPENLTELAVTGYTSKRRRGKSIGMGSVGEPCERKMWMSFHWYDELEELPLWLENLFDTGTKAEEFMVRDLERAGLVVTDRQMEHWGFQNYEHGFDDGSVIGVPEAPKTPHVLEMKTHNDAKFKELVKHGVQKGFPNHYAQCQRYMHARGMTRTLYMGYNKNTSRYYFERIKYDKGFAEDLERKVLGVLVSDQPPTLRFPKTHFACKWCPMNDICHRGSPPNRNCRSCKHSDMPGNGKWSCGLQDDAELTYEAQQEGCGNYARIEEERR